MFPGIIQGRKAVQIMNNPTGKVYGYSRVSTLRMAEEGISLEAQAARVKAYAEAKGWQLSEVLVERGKTGKNMRRPMLERLRREVKAGLVSHVIVLKVDRISRSVRDLLELLEDFKRYGVAFVSVTESIDTSTSLGEFVLTLLGAVAQLERATIADRTTLALKHKRSEGKVYSRIPFGWREGEDKKLVPVAVEQKALAAAKKMREAGESFQAISDFLSKIVRPKGGGKWYPASARQVLNSKMMLETA
jgi:site-specific DNA recombinase